MGAIMDDEPKKLSIETLNVIAIIECHEDSVTQGDEWARPRLASMVSKKEVKDAFNDVYDIFTWEGNDKLIRERDRLEKYLKDDELWELRKQTLLDDICYLVIPKSVKKAS